MPNESPCTRPDCAEEVATKRLLAQQLARTRAMLEDAICSLGGLVDRIYIDEDGKVEFDHDGDDFATLMHQSYVVLGRLPLKK